jgi:hypothetical protein
VPKVLLPPPIKSFTPWLSWDHFGGNANFSQKRITSFGVSWHLGRRDGCAVLRSGGPPRGPSAPLAYLSGHDRTDVHRWSPWCHQRKPRSRTCWINHQRPAQSPTDDRWCVTALRATGITKWLTSVPPCGHRSRGRASGVSPCIDGRELRAPRCS